jgi:5-methyltetrahydrofolate--homocysteine methyltransferase
MRADRLSGGVRGDRRGWADALAASFEAANDDYSAILIKALADRLAGAFAELLHRRVRREWGYGADESLSHDDLIAEKYRGIRPAPGYPACPDHTEKRILFDLMQVEMNTGIRLTENFAMHPGASVSGFYFAHPESRYFAVGKLGRDQMEDYARRKGMTIHETERWLARLAGLRPGGGAERGAIARGTTLERPLGIQSDRATRLALQCLVCFGRFAGRETASYPALES